MKAAKQVMDIAIRRQVSNRDSVFVIIGKEREGKSTLMLNLFDYLGGNIKNICLTGDDFIRALAETKDCDIVCLDEAGDSLFSRDAMSKFNKRLVKTYQVVGAKRLITFLVLPSFFMLDWYFREHRVDFLFYVYKRGRYAYYSSKRIKYINKNKDKKIPLKKSFRNWDSFPNYKGKLLEPYLAMKRQKIQETLENLKKDDPANKLDKRDEVIIHMREQGLTLQNIGKLVGLDKSQVSRILKKSCTLNVV